MIPPYTPSGAQQLLKGMIQVDPIKRMSVSSPRALILSP